jgi:hypothetical protein
MTDDFDLEVQIEGDPELITSLGAITSANSESMTLESLGPSAEPSRLKFGLAEAATLVALVKGAVELAKFAKSIYDHLSKSKGKKVVVQTPLRAVTIGSSDATSEARVAELLQTAAQL